MFQKPFIFISLIFSLLSFHYSLGLSPLYILDTHLGSTVGIAVSALLFLARLLLDECRRFLLVERLLHQVPRQRDVKLSLSFYLAGIVVDSLSLLVGIVVARVPQAVTITVHKGSSVVGAWLDIVEGDRMVGIHLTRFHDLVTLVKQLYDDSGTVSIATDVKEECRIVIKCLYLDTLLKRLTCLVVDVNKGGTVNLKAILRS